MLPFALWSITALAVALWARKRLRQSEALEETLEALLARVEQLEEASTPTRTIEPKVSRPLATRAEALFGDTDLAKDESKIVH